MRKTYSLRYKDEHGRWRASAVARFWSIRGAREHAQMCGMRTVRIRLRKQRA